MKEILWEVHWHYNGDLFSGCTVTPITVTRDSILPGCSAPSITATDSKGVTFTGSRNDYFVSEKRAWQHVAECMEGTIKGAHEGIALLNRQIAAYKNAHAIAAEKVKAL